MLYDSKSEKEVFVLEQIKSIDINQLSPLEAMNKLDELQKKIKEVGSLWLKLINLINTPPI